MKKRLISYFKKHYKTYLKAEKSSMKNLPLPAFWAVYFMTASVLVQGVVDVVLKLIGFTPYFVQFPWRMDFLFLTAISVLMGCQTLIGIKRRELDVTRNSVQIGLLVEIALVVGDAIFIYNYQNQIPESFAVRMPFIILTSINIVILIYLMFRLNLLRDKNGNIQLF